MKYPAISLLLLCAILFPSCDKTENEEWLTDTFLRSVPAREYTAIDLGLSVKWADCNIGGLKSWRNSEYFAWGETTAKSAYTWDNYQFYSSENPSSFVKYNETDGLLFLQGQDDPATALMGAGWRLPTKEEFSQLLNNCDWSISTKNGSEVITATSKKNGASIDFQLMGYIDTKTKKYADTHGFYWSSELVGNTRTEAYIIDFDTKKDEITIEVGDRPLGLCVRGVRAD